MEAEEGKEVTGSRRPGNAALGNLRRGSRQGLAPFPFDDEQAGPDFNDLFWRFVKGTHAWRAPFEY